MTTEIYQGPAIMVGYSYALRLEASAALFPDGAMFVGQVRTKVAADQVLITLSTEAGGFVRISDQELDLNMAANETAVLSVGSVVVDVVRMDLDPDLHLGFALEIPVMLPVTRGLA